MNLHTNLLGAELYSYTKTLTVVAVWEHEGRVRVLGVDDAPGEGNQYMIDLPSQQYTITIKS